MSNSNFTVPPGEQNVQVRIIDSTTRIGKLELGFLMEPSLEGMEHMPLLPSWSFLIEHPSGQRVLFDLGVPKDLHSFAPIVCGTLKERGWEIDVKEEVIDTLNKNGIAANEISAIIWSHWHWDHIGDPSRFPSSTELIVGPGFKDEFLPGYPAKPDAPVRESDFAGRNLREMDFSNSVQVGEFRAIDYFKDGSFYIIDSPGHAVGHLGALARTTTNPDTFIFMGGDLCHHSGEIRPSKHMHIPHGIRPSSITAPITFPCPGDSVYEQLLVQRTGSLDKPFFRPAMGLDIKQAIDTIEKAQVADADSNIWFIYAHDPSLLKCVDLFPLSANAWKENNWRERTLWTFLGDFDIAAKQI
ncbi:uncharacterized protein N7479_010074 [Penicillium vulpinum]|uniref:Metallo-beta-lactamase domain-containing protein n=1 Tax=Penicillium vulpinum TaxID=29845 RepID=A0A1V6RW69_9EURO|nr:uncharacterized protein N7479_010074 [Penicillium vulpinum]KAJ5951661.1 hypothetical protein N7479_010074 [Penicillium vulpinum]OQE05653.1 hypothetical protein PENVUL_c023G06980 [Penicillium vulpinum]